MTEIGGRRAYEIRAPASGRISTLQATIGQFADPRRFPTRAHVAKGRAEIEDLSNELMGRCKSLQVVELNLALIDFQQSQN
jgi:hypothetical protein